MVAGAIYYMVHLKKWGSAKFLPADIGRSDCIQFYRGELERQRDLLLDIWKWAIGPIVPGLAVLFVYQIATAPPVVRLARITGSVASIVVVALVGWLNRRAARRLDSRIAELNHELATPSST